MEELPILDQDPQLTPEMQEVLKNGQSDSRYRIVLALQNGDQISFCHQMEQYRRRTGVLAFPSDTVPCGKCEEYGG